MQIKLVVVVVGVVDTVGNHCRKSGQQTGFSVIG